MKGCRWIRKIMVKSETFLKAEKSKNSGEVNRILTRYIKVKLKIMKTAVVEYKKSTLPLVK